MVAPSKSGDIGSQLHFTSGQRQSVSGRVDESGFTIDCKLKLSGCPGQSVPVLVYARDVANKESFLAEEMMKPEDADSQWHPLSLYVPLSRFAGLNPTTAMTVYVQDPDNSSQFIGKNCFSITPPFQPELVWSSPGCTDDAAMPNGGTGLAIKVRLDSRSVLGQKLASVVILEDKGGHTLQSASGQPLVIPGSILAQSYDFSRWDDAEFNIPYAALAHFDPAETIFARPGIRQMDGSLAGGNIIFNFLAGGSLDTVNSRIQAQSEITAQQIQTLEKEKNTLKELRP